MSRSRICPHCGASAEADWRFCAACNRLLAARPKDARSPSHALRYVTLVGAPVVLLLLVVAILVGQRTSRRSEAPRLESAVSPHAPATREAPLGREGVYLDYQYRFSRDGDKAAALFLPRMLPRDDKIFVGAVRDIVKQAFDDDASGVPSLVPWVTQSGPTQAIRIESDRWAYLVVPIKEDTGEVHSMVITQVPQ